MKRVDFFGLIMVIILGICVTNTIVVYNENISFWKYVISAMAVGFSIFIGVLLFVFAISNLIKSIYFKLKGYSLFPLVCFPFCFIRENNKIRMRFSLNFTNIFRDLLPYDLIDNYDEKCSENILLNMYKFSLKIRVFTRIILALIFIIPVLLLKKCIWILFILSLIVFLFEISFMQTKEYHGELTKIKYINKGFGFIYLAKELCIYTCDNHRIYEEFENKLTLLNGEVFNAFIINTLKHMYVAKCVNKDFIITSETNNYLKKLINFKQIKLNLFDESWHLLKMYMYYSLLYKNENELEYALDEITKLMHKLGAIYPKFYEFFTWYINIGESYKNPLVNFNINKGKITTNDRFCSVSLNYKKCLNDVSNLIKSKLN